MAYRELHVVEVREVLRLWARGRGYRAIARQSAVDRKTVRRYVEAASALGLECGGSEELVDDDLIAEVVSVVKPGAPSTPGEMREHCRRHRALIEGWLDAGCKGPKIVKLLARHTRVVVPLRTLQRFVHEDIGRGDDTDTVRIEDPPPGQVLEVDFLLLGTFGERGTGRRRKLHALLLTAGHSRHQFVWPCLDQARDDVIEGLEAAWQFFGGVFPVVVFDNLRPVVDAPDPLKPKLNAIFVEYMQSRGFEVDPTRVRKPRDKARVERQVSYVRNDYFRGEDFGSVEEAREEAARWCRDDAGMRTHGTTRQHPREVFEQVEQRLLLPMPTEPWDQPEWSTLTLGRDHAVVVAHALYSVPYSVAPGPLRVRRDRSTVKLYRHSRLVKVHPRVAAGQSSIDPADLPPGKAELATRDSEALHRRAEQYGDAVAEYARRLLDGPLPWTRMRHVYRLLGLARRHGAEFADEACRRALELDVVDVVRIDRMLERGLAQRCVLPPTARPQPQSPDNVVQLRFARDPSTYRTRRPPKGDEPDASA